MKQVLVFLESLTARNPEPEITSGWTTVNKSSSGILAWVIGDRSPQTFLPLWKQIKAWNSFWYVTDGYPVYRCFINDIDHLISKTYMTRVEGENTLIKALFS